MSLLHSIVVVVSEVTVYFAYQGISNHEIKSVLLPGQIMFYARISTLPGTMRRKGIQKYDFEKKKSLILKSQIYDI